MPLRTVGSASVKRKAISLANPHPGHETMFCLRSGAARLIRKDDEPRTGDGFGGHGGRAVWEDRCSRPGYQDIKLHCVVEGPPLSGKSTAVRNLGDLLRSRGHPVRLMLETPELWTDDQGQSLLDKCAANPHLYSMHLQALIISRQGKLLAERGGFSGVVLQDR